MMLRRVMAYSHKLLRLPDKIKQYAATQEYRPRVGAPPKKIIAGTTQRCFWTREPDCFFAPIPPCETVPALPTPPNPIQSN